MDDRRILETYPLPLARGYRRFRNAAEVRERHDAAYYLFEIYLKYVGSIAIAHYLAGEDRDHRVNAALKGLARPSLGEWLRFLRECLRFLGEREGPDPGVTAIATLFADREVRWDAVSRLYNRLRASRTGKSGDREKVSLAMLLDELVPYRNRVLGHGAPLEREHYGEFAELLGTAFAELLQNSPSLTARRLVSFDAARIREGSRVECAVIEYMGLQPIRRKDPLTLSYGAPAPREACLHLLSEDGSFLSLDPLLVAYREDVFILNEVDGTPEYLSYATGERHKPSSVGGAQEQLFERILGYRIDETRLSRIGDDVAPATEERVETAPETGERRLGDYRIVREIGHGGMGTVFEAIQESLGRRVALKVLPGSFALDARRVERFRREARATARIHHPSIVPVYEVGEAEGTHYYAMEYVDGPSLGEILTKAREQAAARGPSRGSSTWDPAEIVRAVEQVATLAEGLEEAHRQGLIHRDVKPSNILVDSGGHYILVDFGLVREEEAQTLTRSGEFVGTLQYMSPEQVSRRRVDARSDVYSLGVTLHEILTLRTPFEGESEHAVQNAILFKEPIPPRRLNPRLHRDLETILLHALEKDPDRRYPSAAEFAADLRRFIRYEPIRAKPQSAMTRIRRLAWRHRGRTAAGAAFAVLVLVIGILLYASLRQRRALEIASYEPKVLGAATKLLKAHLIVKVGAGLTARIDRHVLQLRGGFRVFSRELGRKLIEEARAALEDAARILPERADAHFHLARVHLLLGEHDDALAEVEEALRGDPSFVPARILQSAVFEAKGDAGRAKEALERAEEAGGSGWARAWLAAYDAMSGARWKDAIEAYGSLIASQAGGAESYLGASIEAHLARGLAQFEAREYALAIEDFAFVSSRSEDSVEADLLLGKCYYLIGREREAQSKFEEALAGALDKDETALEVAGFCYSFWETGKALAAVERMAESCTRERNRAWFLARSARLGEAIEAGENAIRLDPREAMARAYLADAYRKIGQAEKAAEMMRSAIDLAPENAYLHYIRAMTLRETGDPRGATEASERATALDPQLNFALVELAMSLTDLGEFARAAGHFEEAVRIDPWDFAAYSNLARLRALQGRFEDAIRSCEMAIRLRPNAVTPMLNRAKILRWQGKLVEAMEGYCDAMEIAPDSRPAEDSFSTLLRLLPNAEGIRALVALADRLEESAKAGKESPPLLHALALLRLRLPERRDAAGALDAATRAAAGRGRENPDILATLAEAQFLSEKRVEAVRTLEEAVTLPGAKRFCLEELTRYRKALLPDLPTYGSIDQAIAEAAGPEGLRTPHVTYLAGRRLQREGKHREAADMFAKVIDADGTRPEPFLRRAESLRDAGDPAEAEKVLRGALEKDAFDLREVWEAWIIVSLRDMARTPAEILSDVPAADSIYTQDLRWLLARLAAGNPVRIDCGSKDDSDAEERGWGRDRFFRDGNTAGPFAGEIAGTEETKPYATMRFFASDRIRSGYRIPLPPGPYRVTLHFCEFYWAGQGLRVFDISVEGQKVREDFDPCAVGFATAQKIGPEEVLVRDGMLDIEFSPKVDEPAIAAIEVDPR